MNEATDGVDGLVGDVDYSSTVVLDHLAVDSVVPSANAVDFLVDLGTVMVTFLTGTGNGKGDAGRMPRTNTRHLAETFVSLSWQFLTVPS